MSYSEDITANNSTVFNPASLDRLLHSPKRLAIVAITARVSSASFSYLAERLQLTDADLSQQLRLLKQRGIVSTSKRSGQTAVSITRTGRSEFEQYRHALTELLKG